MVQWLCTIKSVSVKRLKNPIILSIEYKSQSEMKEKKKRTGEMLSSKWYFEEGYKTYEAKQWLIQKSTTLNSQKISLTNVINICINIT